MSDFEIPPGIRNDASISPEAVMRKLAADSIDISYGDLMMRVEGKMVRSAAEWLATKTPEERQHIRCSVTKALDRAVPKILKGNFSKGEADDCMSDLCLIHALNAYRS